MIDLRPLFLSGAAFAAGLSAQDPKPQEPANPPPAKAETPAPKPDVETLVRDLGSERFRARLDAERALRELGEAAVPALQKAAEASDDTEVQWRARRVLRQIEAGKGDAGLVPRARADEPAPPAGAAEPQGQRPWQWRDLARDQFESLFERLEREFGVDVPRARFFDDDFFQDLQEQMKAGGGRSQGMSMQIGPDGAVRVEVEVRGADGKAEKKVYEAPDMDSFQKQHPGVLQRNGVGFAFPGGGMGWFRGFGGQMPLMAPPPVTGRARADQRAPDVLVEPAEPIAPPAGKRLGVTVRDEVPPDVRAYLDLDDGVGLMVERVQDGSLAQALGLQRGDIVTRVAGKPVGAPADVQDALGAVAQGAEIEVDFVRKGATRTAKAPKAEAVEPPAAKPAQPLKKRVRKPDDESIR
ncbi:MAG: PDZ domain-containing protein [Planctomycetes bacterium]|nr:PDZ domain-containing protein [Planctomycetota bacterium]